ncbi:methionine--tRNA ligase [Rickettsiales endosymbiont of Stachyamoeba lipophora]|uniref:methionine--tRNA ligase n=1 Tax=Rickettsiales endosymbiont of Stachyamoeba lipophora TaxID=2486578 RepID=UPI000F64EA72|nr:methionine--tRNA ligase [Rickettsiales endosymbiont of Stachyamoeba lipophora]AZL15110.1 methionine--tRNA ligase [Rickettsiales endosymbiont of Stachyamoeba lipophora]
MNNFYITTPIYYVNDIPHIGHAYTSVAADVLARYHRMRNEEVYFLTGTDEHGQKIASSALKNNKDPQEFTDFYSQKFRDLTIALNLSNNDFIRTTEERHKKAASFLWERLVESGNIYLDSYSGWYAVRDEAFYQESELIDGKAPTGAPVEWVEEPSYFFALSKWQDKLLELYEQNPDFIWPKARRNEVISFVKSGLKDLSVSRTSFNWGVPVPGNDKHIMYVWLDALTNYISALGYPEDTELMKKFWPGIHMVGKDILRFHTVYWPAFLMAANLPVPKQIIAHGWWTNEGQKISKSLGNVIDPYELIKIYGLDQTRYFMLREVPFGNDGNYSKSSCIRRLNSELSNNFGNLMQRVVSFIHKNCESRIPKGQHDPIFLQVAELVKNYHNFMENYEFHNALEVVVNIGNLANIYIDEQAPWNLRKDNPEKMAHVLFVLINIIKQIAILLLPFMPTLSQIMLEVLNVEANDFSELEDLLPIGGLLKEVQPIFPRIEEAV